MRLLAALGALVALPALAAGQDCNPPTSSNEAKVFAIRGTSLAFSPLSAPAPQRTGSIGLTLEGTYLPKIDSATRIPSYCRPGKPAENTNLLSGFIRPRLVLNSSQGFFLELSWVPPIRVSGVKPNLFAIAGGRTVALNPSSMLRARAYWTGGTIHAPFTCPDYALNDPLYQCGGGTISDDSYKPNAFGADLSIGWAIGKLQPYLGIGVNFLRPRFQVNHTDSLNVTDNTKISVNLTRFAAMGGVTLDLSSVFRLGGEVYTQPADVVTGRVFLTYMIRREAKGRKNR
jgi:hypothetical protein